MALKKPSNKQFMHHVDMFMSATILLMTIMDLEEKVHSIMYYVKIMTNEDFI